MAYIPFPFYYDDMPIDISCAFPGEAPAGRHGFLRVRGDAFVFEDGAPGRFWGVNFNGGACFPDFGYSEKVASRLRKTGVNLVRFHQLDAQWDSPNIFAFQKGERVPGTRHLHPESMKRLDYLVKCLKDEGIYCYLDMLTYRNFKKDDGVENASALGDAADPYLYFDRTLIELQKEYMRKLWNHENPYTGLAYKDDPVFVLSEIVNERDLFSRGGFKGVEPYETRFRGAFDAWLRARGIAFNAYACDLNDTPAPLMRYKEEVMLAYNREMYACMREIGVKIPITGTNMCVNGAVHRAVRETCDYSDSHTYFYDWRWGARDKRCMQTALTQSFDIAMSRLNTSHFLEMPFFVSEWDMPWPNEYRAESPILYAAVGALQGYSGWAIHTYAYGTRLADMKILGKEVSSSTIGGVAYREGIFSTWNDPAKYGLFYHAALIARRQDVKKAEECVRVRVTDMAKGCPPALCGALSEYARTGVVYEGDACDARGENEPLIAPEAGEVKSVTGEMYRSWQKNYGCIDSPATKCAYGFLQKNGRIALTGFSVRADTDFAVVALSSLTGEGIFESDNLLLTAVGRARNTDARFEGDRMLDFGKPPVEIEVIEADIEIQTARADLRVWCVNAQGMYAGTVKSEYRAEDGTLCFHIGCDMPGMYYLIQAD